MAQHNQDKPVILCVEDEPELLRDIADELNEAGYQAMPANSVSVAWQLMQDTKPHLILCDISMPVASGYTLLEKVQNCKAHFADIPFVFLTALNDPRDIIQGKRLGADDYLVKPIDYDLLLATIEARLRQVIRIQASFASDSAMIDPQQIAAIYGLTPSEIRVTIALCEGQSLKQVAENLRIARTTVAFHLRNIFQKTNVSRQGELVAKVLKIIKTTK